MTDKTQPLSDRETEILQKSLIQLADTQKMLSETSVELHRQGSLLDKTENKLHHINHMAKESERLSNQITSFWGRITSAFKSSKPYQPHESYRNPPEPVSDETVGDDSGDVLDQLNKKLIHFKNHSLQFNQELTHQDKQLDRISDGLASSQNTIKESDKKLRKLLD
ncbi:hypothetical protein RF11_03453 [Thelohanellus kitauei]|uniref:t-SNARE coiled-coil homology domain-containing protein n=1 Tax=Thelohanellus kitauei TaxID=669202 RepID=A0A0C2MG37_THEKT|nr:hypothetical protein RF11_03453 [Thelohanellus kitauei]